MMDNEAKMLRRNRRMTYNPDSIIKPKREPMFEPILEEESSEHRTARELVHHTLLIAQATNNKGRSEEAIRKSKICLEAIGSLENFSR
jgi:hypothetical protein